MANNSEEQSVPQLFTGMTFYIRPCSIRRSIHILVKKHGGEFSRLRKPTTIVLTEVPEHTTGYHTDFIHDSIKNKKLQPQEKYKLPAYSSAITVNNHIIKMPGSLLNRARQPYSPVEDEAIAEYIAKYASGKDKVGSINGNVIWREMERKNVTIHSWQSMKDRYINHIQHCPPKFKYVALDIVGGGAVASSSDGKRVVAVEGVVQNQCDTTPIGNGSSSALPAPETGDDVTTGSADISTLTSSPLSGSTKTKNTDNLRLNNSTNLVASPIMGGDAAAGNSAASVNGNIATSTPSAVSISDMGGNIATSTPSAVSISDMGGNIATSTPSAVSTSDMVDKTAAGNVELQKLNRLMRVSVVVDDIATKNAYILALSRASDPVSSSPSGQDKATEQTDYPSAPETMFGSKTTKVSANDSPISAIEVKESAIDDQTSGGATPCVGKPTTTVDALSLSLKHKCVGNTLDKSVAKNGRESEKVITGTAGSIERMKNDTETNNKMLHELVQSSQVDFLREPIDGPTGHDLSTDIQSKQMHKQEAVAVDDTASFFTESEDENDDSADEDDDLDKTLLKEAIKVATGADGLLNEASFNEDFSPQQHGECDCYEQVDSSRALKLKEHIESIPGNDPAWISVRNELIMRDIGLKYGMSSVEVKQILLMSRT